MFSVWHGGRRLNQPHRVFLPPPPTVALVPVILRSSCTSQVQNDTLILLKLHIWFSCFARLSSITAWSSQSMMAPPTEAFPASELPFRAQITTQGKRRKGGDIDLRRCELLEMVQYDCRVDEQQPRAPVRCYPIVRLFRK